MKLKLNNPLKSLSTYFRLDIYWRLLPYRRPHALPAVGVVLFVFIKSGFGLLEPWPMAILIDNGLNGRPLAGTVRALFPWLASQPRHWIVIYAILGALLMGLVASIIGIVGDRLKTRVNSSMIGDFKADLFKHLQRLS